MTEIYDFFLHVIATLPPWLVAGLLGWAMSITVTQPLKFALPLNWHPDSRAFIAEGAAFVSAFATAFYVLRTDHAMGFFVGVITGIWSPLAYKVAVLVLERRFPWLADLLSADVRGVMFNKDNFRASQEPRT